MIDASIASYWASRYPPPPPPSAAAAPAPAPAPADAGPDAGGCEPVAPDAAAAEAKGAAAV